LRSGAKPVGIGGEVFHKGEADQHFMGFDFQLATNQRERLDQGFLNHLPI
jgi:hypothetical protein